MPMQPKFYFCSSLCCCCTSLPSSLQRAPWCYSAAFWCCLGTGQTDMQSGETLLRLWQFIWEGASPQEMFLSVLDVLLSDGHWQSGSPCREVTASSAGRALWAWAMNSVLGMWGKQQWVQNFRLKSLVNAVSCELSPELEHLRMQFHGSVSEFKRVVLQNIVNHHSQWSVASCFVMGKCIVGQVSSKPPADMHKSTVFRKCVGSAGYTLTPHGFLSCVLTLPTSGHRHDWCSRG